jgi:hypothetical protein
MKARQQARQAKKLNEKPISTDKINFALTECRVMADGWIGGINVVGLVHERSCLLCGEVGASADIASRMRVSRFVDKSTGIVY